MNRTYLAQLIGRLTELNVSVIGIDYLLDRPHQNLDNGSSDTILTQTLKTAVENHHTWLIFVSKRDLRQGWIGVLPEIADPNWSLQGRMNFFKQGYMQLHIPQTPAIPLPFSHLLALSHYFTTHPEGNPLQPNLNSTEDLKQQILSYLSQSPHPLPATAQTSPITAFSYLLKQMWLHPIIDYSLPPSQVYYCLTAWQFLAESGYGQNGDSHACHAPPNPQTLTHSIVIIAPGGYDEAGTTPGGDNLTPPPAAFEYWTKQNLLTGGEIHGYMLDHLLKNRLVVPLPDLWMTLVAALLAKGLTLMVGLTRSAVRQTAIALSIGTIVYGLLSLQAYISMAILLPWFFPTIMVWGFVLSQTIHNRE
jgi:hypothetical protein